MKVIVGTIALLAATAATANPICTPLAGQMICSDNGQSYTAQPVYQVPPPQPQRQYVPQLGSSYRPQPVQPQTYNPYQSSYGSFPTVPLRCTYPGQTNCN